MGTFKVKYKEIELKNKKDKGFSFTVMPEVKFDSFTPFVLGLGDISRHSKEIDALAVMFDLQDFTNFMSKTGQYLRVPSFLSQFLDWLFRQIRNETAVGEKKRTKGPISRTLPGTR